MRFLAIGLVAVSLSGCGGVDIHIDGTARPHVMPRPDEAQPKPDPRPRPWRKTGDSHGA